MGMFDYVYVEMALPQVPESVVNNWRGSDKIAFQTKNTPNQAMSTYKIDATGQLWIEEKEGHWENGTPAADDADIDAKLAAIGQFVTDKKWWEADYFSGSIRFYESYSHPDYYDEPFSSDTKWLQYECGWIEYCALFQNGKLVGDIILIESKEPKKLSDEELAERIARNKERRKQDEISFREHRKKYPTAEQKLIDNISRECKLAEHIMEEDDLDYALGNIVLFIREYRKKYDIWYEEDK